VAICMFGGVFKVQCITMRGRWSVVFDPVLHVEDAFLLGVADILLRELGILITTLFLKDRSDDGQNFRFC
jgi:hypothetical protein